MAHRSDRHDRHRGLCDAMVLSGRQHRPGGGTVNWDRIEDAAVTFILVVFPVILLGLFALLWAERVG